MEDLTFDQLPPEAQAAFGAPKQEAGPAQEFVDPVDVEDVAGLVRLAVQSEGFKPAAHAKANAARYESDEAYRDKLEQFNAALKERGFEWEDVSIPKGAKALYHMGTGLYNWYGKMESSISKAIGQEAKTPVGKAIQSISGPLAGPGGLVRPIEKLFGVGETQVEVNKRLKEASKESAEVLASAEQGAEGIVEMAETAGKKIYRALPGTPTPKDWSKEERAADLRNEIEKLTRQEAIATGQGEASQVLIGSALKDLGVEADPAEIAKMVDPISFLAIPGGFKLVGFLGGKTIQLSSKVLSRTQAAQAVATLNTARETAFRTAQNAVKAGKVAGAMPKEFVEGATQAQPALGTAAVGAASRTAQAAEQAAKNLAKVEAELPAGAKALQRAQAEFNRGRNLVGQVAAKAGQLKDRGVEAVTGAGIATVGTGLQGLNLLAKLPRIVRIPLPKNLGKDMTAAGVSLAKEGTGTWSPWAQLAGSAVKGGVDVGLGAAKGIAFGDIPFAALISESPEQTANFPFFGGAMGGAAAGKYRVRRAVYDQALTQSVTDASIRIANSPGSDAALNLATEAAAKGADEGKIRRFAALRSAAASRGVEIYWASPEKGNTEISPYRAAINRLIPPDTQASAEQAPGFITKTSGGKPVIVVKDPGTAGHEFVHAGQMLFGDAGMQVVRDAVAKEYADSWDRRGQVYVSRFGGNLNAYALRGESWRDALLDITKPGWREEGWSPEKVVTESDLYLNDELSAEVIDFVMQNTGPELQRDTGLPGFIALPSRKSWKLLT